MLNFVRESERRVENYKARIELGVRTRALLCDRYCARRVNQRGVCAILGDPGRLNFR